MYELAPRVNSKEKKKRCGRCEQHCSSMRGKRNRSTTVQKRIEFSPLCTDKRKQGIWKSSGE